MHGERFQAPAMRTVPVPRPNLRSSNSSPRQCRRWRRMTEPTHARLHIGVGGWVSWGGNDAGRWGGGLRGAALHRAGPRRIPRAAAEAGYLRACATGRGFASRAAVGRAERKRSVGPKTLAWQSGHSQSPGRLSVVGSGAGPVALGSCASPPTRATFHA